jgi:serine/threonine protein kinase
VLSQLLHPHIVQAYDAGPFAGGYFLAMEYVEGTELSQLVKKRGPLPVAEACAYVRQAALGLHHLHERGLCHRALQMPPLVGASNTASYQRFRFEHPCNIRGVQTLELIVQCQGIGGDNGGGRDAFAVWADPYLTK